jgi:hypothetical protein
MRGAASSYGFWRAFLATMQLPILLLSCEWQPSNELPPYGAGSHLLDVPTGTRSIEVAAAHGTSISCWLLGNEGRVLRSASVGHDHCLLQIDTAGSYRVDVENLRAAPVRYAVRLRGRQQRP